jgi:hypothetical protein
MGLRLETDQINGMAFLRTHLQPALTPARFQPQAHDNVLRQTEREHGAFAKVCFYILHNPVAAELVSKPEDWPYCGAIVPCYPTLHPLQADFWEKFWRLHATLRHSDASNIKRPPF